ncbi:NYN domain-containing protein [Dehalococcoidales bacterium]|nr:NYN domain-containing protein [Dehalococcoidales bacterium]
MNDKKTNRVDAFVDWENIRQRLSDNYIEKVSIDQVMEAVKKVANEIGQLRQATFYGDFTLRREDARVIERKTHFRIRNVLRSRRGKDQTDPVLITELTEAIFTPQDFDSILLCSGDSHYCEPIRKASIRGIKVYICAVGLDVSPDLTSLAPFYPMERYLDIPLTRKMSEQQILIGLSPKDIAHWSKFVSILDSIESTLPFVALSYFHKDIMLSYSLGGQTQDDRWSYLESARESGIISIEQIDNPARPGFKMRVIKLNRDHAIVKEILARK